MQLGQIIGAGYRAFIKFVRWYGRIVTSAMAGLMAALALCLLGSKLAGPHNGDQVNVLLIIPALLLWIFVSVISYRFLKPKPDERQ
jgi:4-hydroxybenzoate polyprenyltransferase